MLPRRGLVLLAVVGLMFAACSGGNDDTGGASGATIGGPTKVTAATGGSGTTGAASVDVTEKDFAIAVDASTVDAGTIAFSIRNEGPSPHEFVIFKTDLAPDQLPLNDDGTVDEEGEGVEHIDEVEDIAPGSTEPLEVDLDAGSYVFICNLPGHYTSGMNVGFTVS
jgi:uncharacterized cupredoxin-like copper-binding protein